MTIDWITVSAQIVNFLVLVWLLKRFLYGPVVDAMEQRERRIRSRVEEADRLDQEASRRVDDYETRLRELEAERGSRLAAAREEAREEKRELMEAARQEVRQARRDWQRGIESEQEAFRAELQRRLAATAVTLAGEVLGEMAGRDLEQQMVASLVERLDGGQGEALDRLAEDDNALVVTSSRPLGTTSRDMLVRAIESRLPGTEVRFAESSGLLCGIELDGGGLRVGWNLAERIDALAADVDAVFEQLPRIGEGA